MPNRSRRALLSRDAAASPVVALLVMAVIAIVLAAGLYAAIARMDADNDPPWVTLRQDSAAGTLLVVAARSGTDWSELHFIGCANAPASGAVEPGMLVRGCSGADVRLVHTPTGILLSRFDFTR